MQWSSPICGDRRCFDAAQAHLPSLLRRSCPHVPAKHGQLHVAGMLPAGCLRDAEHPHHLNLTSMPSANGEIGLSVCLLFTLQSRPHASRADIPLLFNFSHPLLTAGHFSHGHANAAAFTIEAIPIELTAMAQTTTAADQRLTPTPSDRSGPHSARSRSYKLMLRDIDWARLCGSKKWSDPVNREKAFQEFYEAGVAYKWDRHGASAMLVKHNLKSIRMLPSNFSCVNLRKGLQVGMQTVCDLGSEAARPQALRGIRYDREAEVRLCNSLFACTPC